MNCEESAAIANFIFSILRFSMTRYFIRLEQNQLTASGTLSLIISERVFDGVVPKQCKHFCGRENELNELHELLSRHK